MSKISASSAKTIKFIDLFCGVGGIRLGMENAGFRCIFSCDINEDCQKTYLANFGELPKGDIKIIDEKTIPDHQILCAGFPCQPFSISGRQKGFADTRGTMFFEICRIIKAKTPSVVMLENVKHLIYHDHGNTLKTIIQNLEDLGYTVNSKVLNAIDFGIPQNRERILIIGSKNGIKFDFARIKTQRRKQLVDFLDKEGNFEFLKEDSYTLLENPKQQLSGLIFKHMRRWFWAAWVYLNKASPYPYLIHGIGII